MIETNAANLHHFPLFDMLTDEELALLSRQLKPASYAMGQTIVDRSGPPDALYIIVEGKARKIGLNQAGTETNLGLLQPGDHFGEHSLFGCEKPAAITIRASTPLEVLRLDQAQFKELVERHPDLGAYFRKYIDSDVMRTFLKNNTLFTHVDQAALRSLLNRLDICTYESGACLVREGEPGDAFYILKTGAALVERGAEAAIVNRLYPGDFFGELALLTGEPRKATIRAAEPVTAFRLGRDDFEALVTQFPRILEAIRPIASHYSTQAMTMIHAPEQADQNVEPASVMPPPDHSELSPRIRLSTWFSWKRRQKYPVLLQQSEMDCGPTCLTMIARYYGLNASVNRMRERCNVGAEGTSMLGLVETLESIGFSAKGLKTTSSVLHELKTPFIAHWNGNHYTVVYEVGKHHLLVANPALGYLDTVPLETFNSHWTGLVITLEPNEPLAALDDTEVLWKRYLAHLNPSRKLLLSTLGLSLVTECLLLVFPVMSQQIFDRVIDTANWSLLHVMLLGMLALVLFNAGFIFMRQKMIGKLAYAVDHSMLESFYRQLFRLPFSYFFKRTSGDILTRVYENEKIRRMMTEHAIELVLDGLTLLVYGGLMVYYHPMLALVSFALMPLYFALYAVMLPQMRRNFRKQMIAEGETQTQIVEAVNAIATVKGLSLESFIRSKLMAKLSRLFTLRLEGSRLEAVTRASSSGLRSVSNVALLYLGSRYVLAGQLSIGELVAYTVLFTSFQFALELISQRSGELAEARISMERLNDVFESTPEHPQPEQMRMLPSIQGHIRFDKVSFRYHRGGSMVLQHLDFELKPGQTVALIGRSGSGKSTLANLLLKLLEPSSGEIYVDGYPLRSVHAASIRKQVGVVQQETVLFKGSVRDNIAMNGEEISLEEVQRAAQLAGAHAFIESLPLSYDTMIGEGGLRLSGGQRQRIVIARALVHNPRILIFDEATSALDTESERIIQTNMSEMLQGRTTLIIAHRLSTIRQADLIVVLDQGSIVESGTHEQLVLQQGMYHHLLQQQSLS